MTPRDPQELQKLIGELSDGTLTSDGVARLESLLRGDWIAQESYLDHLMIDGLLEREFRGSELAPPPQQPHPFSAVTNGYGSSVSNDVDKAHRLTLLRRRAVTWSLASCLLLALGGAVGWLLSIRGGGVDRAQPVALADAGFELTIPLQTDSAEPDAWEGDRAESVGRYDSVAPMEGDRMLRFVTSSAEPDRSCDVYQLVDLRTMVDELATRGLAVEASAFFNSLDDRTSDGSCQFGITVFAFAEKPLDDRHAWLDERPQPLTVGGRQLLADAEPGSWQKLDTQLPLPPETRYLIVQLSVAHGDAESDEPFQGQFADNVALSLVSSREAATP